MLNLFNKIKHIGTLTFANFFQKAIAFLLPIFAVRILGEIQYGRFSLVLNTLSTVTSILIVPITSTISKLFAQNKINNDVRVEVTGKLFILIGFVMLSFIGFVTSLSLFNNSLKEIQNELFVGIWYIVFTLIVAMLSGKAYVNGDFNRLGVAIIFGAIIQFASMLVLTYGFNVYGLIISYAVYPLTQIFLLIRKDKDLFSDIWLFVYNRAKYKSLNVIKDYILPNTLSFAIVTMVVWWSNIIITNEFGFVAMGYVGSMFQLQVLVSFLPYIINSIIFPKLTRLYSENRILYFKRSTQIIYSTIIYSVVATFIVYFVFDYLISLYSGLYLDYKDASNWFILAFAASAFVLTINQLILSYVSFWWSLISQLVWATTFVTSLLMNTKSLTLLYLSKIYFLSYILQASFLLLFFFLTKSKHINGK